MSPFEVLTNTEYTMQFFNKLFRTVIGGFTLRNYLNREHKNLEMFDNNVIMFLPCFCLFLGCSFVNFSTRSSGPNTTYRVDNEGGYVSDHMHNYSFYEPNSHLNLALLALCKCNSLLALVWFLLFLINLHI